MVGITKMVPYIICSVLKSNDPLSRPCSVPHDVSRVGLLDRASALGLTSAFLDFDGSEEAWRRYDKMTAREVICSHPNYAVVLAVFSRKVQGIESHQAYRRCGIALPTSNSFRFAPLDSSFARQEFLLDCTATSWNQCFLFYPCAPERTAARQQH